MPSTTILLLLDGALREENPLLVALQPLGETRRFPQLNDQQLTVWVEQRFSALGAIAEPAAVRLLVRTVHADLWQMAGEVEKLALYTAGRTVTEADARTLVAAARESNVFAMVDAIADGRGEAALQQLEALMQAGAVAPYLLTMIARQYRQLIVAQDLLSAGAGPQAIQKAAEVRSEAGMRRLMQQARRSDATMLQQRLERILEADLAIKRGQGDERVILQLLVTDLAGAPGAVPGRREVPSVGPGGWR